MEPIPFQSASHRFSQRTRGSEERSASEGAAFGPPMLASFPIRQVSRPHRMFVGIPSYPARIQPPMTNQPALPKVPKEAQDVIDILSRDTNRPSEQQLGSRWMRKFSRYPYSPNCVWRTCPLGLHPTALCPCPVNHNSFSPGPLHSMNNKAEDKIREFWRWWDDACAIDPEAAADIIWP